MRNALIVLVVVALLLVGVGAVNNGLLFDIDFVAATWTAVSLFWVAVVIAGLVVVTGVVAALLARSGAVAAQRKLEKELQTTYERLRAAEAKAPRPAPAQPVVDAAPGGQTAVTGVAPAPDGTRAGAMTIPEAETSVTAEPPEAETVLTAEPREAETAVIEAAPATDEAGAVEAPADAGTDAAPAADATQAPPPAAAS